MLTVVPDGGPGHDDAGGVAPSLIDEIVREGARRMLAEALRAGVDAYIARFADERGGDGRRLVVRSGYHQPREVLAGAGAVEVTVPRVNDKRAGPVTGERRRFSPVIVPPWARKTPTITEVLPLLYLHGLSSGYCVPALGRFPGSSAGLSPAVITRLTEQWKAGQRAFAARDLSAAGDGAPGLWNARREVVPEAREGRCWFRQTANVLAALPKSAHPGAKKALAGIWGAEDKDHALAAVKAFDAAYGALFPQAAAKITDDAEELLAFFGYPCEHWVHLRTANPIQSTFATVRHRTTVTKGPGSRAAGPAMAFKLIEAAQDRWRAVTAPHLVAPVRAGATFTGGKPVDRAGDQAA